MTVDINSIINFCDDRSVFTAGKKYFDDDRVYKVLYMPETRMLKCKVHGSNFSHNVEVIFGEDDIESTKCDCGKKYGINGVCKHIVAGLLEYEKEQSDELDEKGRKFYEKVSENVLESISEIRLSRNKKIIKLVPCLEFSSNKYGFYSVNLELAVGVDKLYKIRKLDKFLDAIQNGESVEYSKNFVFNAKTQGFGEKENQLIEYLMTLKQLYKEAGKPLNDKNINLTGAILLKVITLVSKVEDRLIIINKEKSVNYPIFIDKFEFPIDISKNENSYIIDFEKWKDIKAIDPSYKIIKYENSIHIITPEQAVVLKTLCQAGNDIGTGKIKFSSSDKNTIIEQIMPKLRYLSDLTIDENIRKDVIIADLKIKIYLETTTDKTIKAKVVFDYDGIVFNHFANEKPDSGEKVLLRDKRKENDFIRMAAKMGFVPQKGFLCILEPQKIYEFLENGLEKLTVVSDIFYSDSFFALKVIMPTRAVGSINIGVGDMFEFKLDMEDIPADELENVLLAVREKRNYYRLTNGNFVNLKSKALENASELLENVDGELNENGTTNISLAKAMYIETEKLNESLQIERSKSFTKIIESLNDPVKSEFEVPKSLKKIMRGYQIDGYKWLKTMASYGFGGILADEMGLGKTLQTIAFLISEFENDNRPSLVVVPTSLLFNWQAEFEKFAPEYNVKVVCGLPEERKEILEDITGCTAVITSYGLIRRDIKYYSKINWKYCFADEAQHIKNPNTVNAKAIKRVKADGFFAITGTPIENNLTELWSIFDFIMPGYLFSRAKYRKVYEIPIIKENDKESTEKLLHHTKPFILRRLKNGVMKELPEKIETNIITDLEQEQKILYKAYAFRAKEEILRLAREKGFEKSRIEILAQITRLRQLCCHPGLFIENFEGGSGKLNTLIELVEDGIASGRRMLIFSQFTSMLNIIAEVLRQMGIDYFYLDGSVKSSTRIQMCSAFNEGIKDVFLISLKAGGTGLNLVGADTVIHYDPWWNPAVENQATDRAHRIGQTKAVQVIKLITKGTIEEKIQNLKEKKQELINSVLHEGTGEISSMALEEIQGLFEE